MTEAQVKMLMEGLNVCVAEREVNKHLYVTALEQRNEAEAERDRYKKTLEWIENLERKPTANLSNACAAARRALKGKK